MRDSFIFFKEYKDAIDCLNDNKKKLQFYECMIEYAFYGTIPNKLDAEVKAMFILIKNKMDKTNKSYWNFEARRSSDYKKWKEKVLDRDSYTCRNCGSKEDLVVHHITHFADNVDLRFEESNGITLCQTCHKEVHRNEK
jgi:nitrate/TMAO reductase-like tetraheme cytochrome c subunit